MSIKFIFKVIVILFSVVYLVLIVTGYMSSDRKLGPSEYALIAFTILFVADFFDKLAEISFGKEGFKMQLKHMEGRQNELEDIISAVQVSLKGMITKYEYKHLLNIDAPEHYLCSFGHIFFDEIKRLDSTGLIRPTQAFKDIGFNVIKDRHENDRNQFDLKEYVEITDEGKAYLHVRAIIKAEDYRLTQRPSGSS